MKNKLLIHLGLLLWSTSLLAQKIDHDLFEVDRAKEKVSIDGKSDEAFWSETKWRALDQRWLGEPYTSTDFSGRYKIRWQEGGLVLLVEVVDDILFDQYKDPFTLWWDDDCVEVFVDPDNSGGGHQYNNNAFAYHISLSGDVIDIASDEKPRNYKEHVQSAHTQNGKTTTWELFVKLYDDQYTFGSNRKANTLHQGEHIGFALAYCDNDSSKERENFIGNVFVPGEDKNLGWINASIFSTIILK